MFDRLGFNYTKPTFGFEGRPFALTEAQANVMKKLLAQVEAKEVPDLHFFDRLLIFWFLDC
jgi:hypothetical protein